jgi:hypothetical protein
LTDLLSQTLSSSSPITSSLLTSSTSS